MYCLQRNYHPIAPYTRNFNEVDMNDFDVNRVPDGDVAAVLAKIEKDKEKDGRAAGSANKEPKCERNYCTVCVQQQQQICPRHREIKLLSKPRRRLR